MKPVKKRMRRTMLFLNAQRAALVKEAYIYKPDTVMFDLEDAVAEREKDSARFSLYNTMKTVDYQGVERIVRINASDTPHFHEDIRVAVASGVDGIRVPKCESAKDIHEAEKVIAQAEKEFGVESGRTLMMAAIESPRGVINALELAESSPRIFGIAIGAGDYLRNMHTSKSSSGIELLGARTQLIIAARAAGVQCFDTVYMDVDNLEGFEEEVRLIKQLGFDGKSIISPKQIPVVHRVFAPTEQEIKRAEKIIIQLEENEKLGVGVFLVDGQMVDIALLEGAQRTIELAKASGVYKGDLL